MGWHGVIKNRFWAFFSFNNCLKNSILFPYDSHYNSLLAEKARQEQEYMDKLCAEDYDVMNDDNVDGTEGQILYRYTSNKMLFCGTYSFLKFIMIQKNDKFITIHR